MLKMGDVLSKANHVRDGSISHWFSKFYSEYCNETTEENGEEGGFTGWGTLGGKDDFVDEEGGKEDCSDGNNHKEIETNHRGY